MKNLNLKNGIFALMMLGGVVAFQGCKDECKDVTCLNGGTCDKETGECICTTGYEGTDCGTALNRKFVGSWSLIQSCDMYPGPDTSAITITASTGSLVGLQVQGIFFSSNLVVDATVEADGITLTIPRQVQSVNNFREIEGVGTINAAGSSISIDYTTYADGFSPTHFVCQGVMTK